MRADVDAQMHQVAVTELDALGTARGARGIDDRRQGLRGQGRTAPIELGVLHVAAGLDETQDVLALHAQDLQARQLRDRGSQRSDHGGHGLVLHDDEPHPGIGEDPLGLLGRGRLVDGNHHQARLPGGEVQQRPLIRGVRHDAYSVARLEPPGHQPCSHLTYLGVEGTGAHLPPAPPQRGLAGNEPAVGIAANALGQCPGRCHSVVNRDQELSGVLPGRGGGGVVGREGGGVGHGGKYARPGQPMTPTPADPYAWSCRCLR